MRGPYVTKDVFDKLELTVATVEAIHDAGDACGLVTIATKGARVLAPKSAAAKLSEGDQIVIATGLAPLCVRGTEPYTACLLSVAQSGRDRPVRLEHAVPEGSVVH